MANPWFRFGLPLGSGLILAGILDTAGNIYVATMDLGGMVVSYLDSKEEMDSLSTCFFTSLSVWIPISFIVFWFGVIGKGSYYMLCAWILLTLCGVTLMTGIWMYVLHETWIYNDSSVFLSEVYVLATFIIMSGYITNLAIQCLNPIRNLEILEPIGRGFKHIIKFYKEDSQLLAKLMLTSELVFLVENIFTRQILTLIFHRTMEGHENDTSFPIIFEEYFLRLLRLLLASYGLYLLTQNNYAKLQMWRQCYFMGMIASSIIFGYILFKWSSENSYFTYLYYNLFFISLVYRGLIFFSVTRAITPLVNSTSLLNLSEAFT